MDPNGYRRGYEYEYLQEMARYGGWRYEYVSGSREECLKMLQEGRVDVVGGLFYTETAARSFDFVKYETDETYTILAVNAKDGRYTMDGWEGFDGMRIGVIPVWKTTCTNYTITPRREASCLPPSITKASTSWRGR